MYLGIQCAQGHHLCMGCSVNLVGLFLAEPNINLPPRCMICKIKLNSSVFERQLLPYQLEKYTMIMLSLLWSKDCLQDNEELIHCGMIIKIGFIYVYLFLKHFVHMQKFELNQPVLNLCFVNMKIVEKRELWKNISIKYYLYLVHV